MRKWSLLGILTAFLCLYIASTVSASQTTYTVKSGDCLWTISQKTGVSVETIKQLSGLKSDSLQIGQVLVLSQPSPVVSTAPVITPAPVISGGATTVYVVVSGDNLWAIAQRFGTTVDNIMSQNGLASDKLQVGDTLIINGTPVSTPPPASSPTTDPTPDVSRGGSSATGGRIIDTAAKYLGTPYAYGGSSPAGFDCSGFTQYIFKQYGISLNRTAASQYQNGVAVSMANLQPGDLVFFNCGGSGINHVGIYAGKGEIIHSSSPRSGGVIYSSITSGYYANTYIGARRVIR